MAIKPWPIVTDGLYGDVPIGMYPAKDSNYELVLLPFGGLKEFCDFPLCTEVREAWSWGDYMYWAARRGSDTAVFRVDVNGTYSEIGSFSSSFTGPMWMRNNTTQLGLFDGTTGYVYTPSNNSFVQITDPDFTGGGCLEHQDGYGISFRPGTNVWIFSTVNDYLSYDALDFYSKEARTDNIRTIRSFQRELYIFGTEKGTEVWYNAGGDGSTPQNPTFARNAGGLIEFGAASAKSDSDLGGTAVVFLSTQGQLIEARGTNAAVISNQMFDRQVAGDGTAQYPGYATIADAIAFSYRDQGHVFHQVTFPSADETWVYDGTTKLLMKRRSWKASGGYGRHRANCYTLFKGKHYVGDYENGKVYEMSASYVSDAGNNIQRVLHSVDINSGRQRTSFPGIQVLIEAGQGLPDGSAPQVGLEFSRDGGKTWSNMVNRSVGAVGQYQWQVNYPQMGSDYRRMYRLTMTDQIQWKIVGLDFGI